MPHLTPGEYSAELNGNRIHYTIRGSGPALIAHSGGPGMDARLWDDLAEIDEFVTVIILHPRGSGLSDAPEDGAYALSDYVDDIEALRRHLDLEKPALLGWSHGGVVAQQYARTYPKSLSKLILYGTFTHLVDAFTDPEKAFVGYSGQPWYEESLKAVKAWWGGELQSDEEVTEACSKAIKFYFRTIDDKAEQYFQRTANLMLRLAPLATFWQKEASGLDHLPGLKDVKVPTLVMAGRQDFVAPMSMSEDIARRIPGARLEIFEESGHFAHVEEPERFHQVIKQFVLDEKANEVGTTQPVTRRSTTRLESVEGTG